MLLNTPSLHESNIDFACRAFVKIIVNLDKNLCGLGGNILEYVSF